ncbi:glycosyltransferase family 61 protein [Roseovarius sp.]|uniref:glycosyltransferase family 61 protein n=1 Tax=Roseovarius sp. TaxID=1486281 RepID=UPI00356497B0
MYCSDETMTVQEVPAGIVLPRRGSAEGPRWGLGGVCDADNVFVTLSAYDGGWGKHGGYYPWQTEDYRDEEVVYFGPFFRHWGHFLVDLVGRAWFFTYRNPQPQHLKIAYLGEHDPSGNYLEFFELLGITPQQMIRITKPTRFKKVIVPQFSCRSCAWYTEEYRSIFDHMARRVRAEDHAPAALKHLRKVYFSRLAFGKAKKTEAGEDQIAAWLNENGFSLIGPETLSLRDQIYLWNHADEVVCLNGSIPMNVAFSLNSDLRLLVLNKASRPHCNLDLFLMMRPCEATLLDAYREPIKGYPKTLGSGPFLLSMTDDLRQYSQQNHLEWPFTDHQLLINDRTNTGIVAFRILKMNIRRKIIAPAFQIVPKGIKTRLQRLVART